MARLPSINKQDREDAEATEFACRLLVPDELLAKEKFDGLDWAKDETLKNMAKKYQVPMFVMAKRLEQFRAEHKTQKKL